MILRSDLTTPPAVGCRRHMQHRSGVSLASIECPNRTSRATNDAPWSLANDGVCLRAATIGRLMPT